MSVRRLLSIPAIPICIKRIFNSASNPISPEEKLWRTRAIRMTLDALGYTNLTMKPVRHNDAVRYARRWYRGLFSTHPDPDCVDNPEATFDAAGLIGFKQVRNAVSSVKPFIFGDDNGS